MADHKQAFDRIIQQALNSATNVKCSKREYKEGLECWMEEISMNLSAVNDELDNEDS